MWSSSAARDPSVAQMEAAMAAATLVSDTLSTSEDDWFVVSGERGSEAPSSADEDDDGVVLVRAPPELAVAGPSTDAFTNRMTSTVPVQEDPAPAQHTRAHDAPQLSACQVRLTITPATHSEPEPKQPPVVTRAARMPILQAQFPRGADYLAMDVVRFCADTFGRGSCTKSFLREALQGVLRHFECVRCNAHFRNSWDLRKHLRARRKCRVGRRYLPARTAELAEAVARRRQSQASEAEEERDAVTEGQLRRWFMLGDAHADALSEVEQNMYMNLLAITARLRKIER